MIDALSSTFNDFQRKWWVSYLTKPARESQWPFVANRAAAEALAAHMKNAHLVGVTQPRRTQSCALEEESSIEYDFCRFGAARRHIAQINKETRLVLLTCTVATTLPVMASRATRVSMTGGTSTLRLRFAITPRRMSSPPLRHLQSSAH